MVEGNFNEFSIQFTLNFTADPNDPWTYFMSANAFVSSSLHKVSLSCNVNRFEQTGTIKVSLFWSGMTGWTIIKWLHEMIIWCNLFYNITFWYDLRNIHRASNIITHMAVFHPYDYFCIILVIVGWDCVFLNSYPEMIFTPRNHFSNGTFLYPAKTSDSLFSPF